MFTLNLTLNMFDLNLLLTETLNLSQSSISLQSLQAFAERLKLFGGIWVYAPFPFGTRGAEPIEITQVIKVTLRSTLPARP